MRRSVLAPRSDLIGIGLAISSAMAFGTLAIFAKEAYAAEADPVPLLALRFIVTSLILVAYQLLRRAPLLVGRDKLIRLFLLGAFGYAVESSLFFLALERAPASVVGLVFYSYPLWTTLIAIALRLEKFEKRLLIALALGTTGVASIFSLTGTPLAGPLFALAAAVMVALFYIGAQVLTKDTPSSAAATLTAVGAAVAMSLVYLIRGGELPSGAIGPGIGLGVATSFAFIATYAAIARIGSSRTAIANMMELVTTIVLAMIFLDEQPTLRVLIGAALVLGAIPILAIGKKEMIPAPDAI
jgi:drug/metabolite transporter (DMT)-like permease